MHAQPGDTPPPPSQPRMYGELARYWPLIGPTEEYEKEATFWRQALRTRLGPGRHRVLELGVGGGSNMSHLTGDFDFTAVDLSPDMVEQARRINPGVRFHVGDMRTVRLGETFDAVFIHDAISYMATEDDLRATFAMARAHLREGGVFVTAPDWFGETFGDPMIVSQTHVRDGVELTLLEYVCDPDPTDTRCLALMWYMIRHDGGEPRVEEDRHEFGLFPLATWERLITEAGMRFEKDAYDVHPDGQEAWLLVGVRRPG